MVVAGRNHVRRPLGATQLNASVSAGGPDAAGAVSYSPFSGTVLNAGAHQALTVNVADPEGRPLVVQEIGWAANPILCRPYVYGRGHRSFVSHGYDCSGTVSYVLHAAGLLPVSMDSGQFMTWGKQGAGRWMTIYTNPGHAFVQIAGIRLDTSAEADPNPPPGSGPRWRPIFKGKPSGFMARHPAGY